MTEEQENILEKTNFNQYDYPILEQNVCSYDPIVNSNINEQQDLYQKYAKADTLLGRDLEEGINNVVSLLKMEDTKNSMYITSLGTSKKISHNIESEYEEDKQDYKRLTNPSQIRITKSGNNYEISKEYGNIFDDSREVLKHNIERIKYDYDKKILCNHHYNVNIAKDNTIIGIERVLEKNRKGYSYQEINDVAKNIYNGSKIELELDKLKPKGLVNLFIKISNNLLIKDIKEEIIKGDAELNKTKERIKIHNNNMNKEISIEKEKLRMINRLEKSMTFTLKDGEKFKLSNVPLILQEQRIENTQDKKMTFKM